MIKVGMLVSYDFKYLYYSLPLLYEHADEIVLCIDRDRKSWTGMRYDIPDAFFEWVVEYDRLRKIRIYEDRFFVHSTEPMVLDTNQRRLLAEQLGEGGWHIQIDADEYLLNFGDLVRQLRQWWPNRPTTITGSLITLYKEVEGGFLAVTGNEEGQFEQLPIATNSPQYARARWTESHTIAVPVFAVHQSWARTRVEVDQKVRAWGHAHDFDFDSYLRIWEALDRGNYRFVRDFHPIWHNLWPSLTLLEASDALGAVQWYQEQLVELKRSWRKKHNRLLISPVRQVVLAMLRGSDPQ